MNFDKDNVFILALLMTALTLLISAGFSTEFNFTKGDHNIQKDFWEVKDYQLLWRITNIW